MKYLDKGEYILDTTTGLGWEKWVRDGDPVQTVAAVNAANVGGRSDWRVPTIRELETLPDLTRMNPAIDPAFATVLPGSYRSSTKSQRSTVGSPDYIWVITSADGRSVHEQPRPDTHMRLVCGTWALPAVVTVDAVTARQGTVLWKRYPEATNMTPRDAAVFAAQDRTGGRTWRLPTVQEALRRMDRALTTYPALDTRIFPTVPVEPILTSTPALDVGHNGFFWAVDPNGMNQPVPPQFMLPVWLVSDTVDVIAPPVPTPAPPPVTPPVVVPSPVYDDLVSKAYVRSLLTELLSKI